MQKIELVTLDAKILALCYFHPEWTARQMAEGVGCTERTALNTLQKLKWAKMVTWQRTGRSVTKAVTPSNVKAACTVYELWDGHLLGT